MSTIGDRIRKLRESKGLTQDELGRKIGTTKQTIFKYETGKIGNIPYSRLLDIATALGAEPWDILGWKQPLQEEEDVPGFISVPFISQKISAGYGEDYLADDSITLRRIQIPESMTKGVSDKSTLVSAEVKGDSMINARIYDGDLVYIREQPDVENGEIAAVLIGDEATLKRVYKYPGQVVLQPENPQYPPLVYTGEQLQDFRILGKAVAFLSRVK